MKKIAIVALLIVTGATVMAGGNIIPSTSYKNADKSCKDDKVYVDYDENLMWQDASYGDAEDGAYKRNYSAGKAGKWKYAKNYCSSLFYGGYDDWRLPTIGEMVKVYDKKLGFEHTIGTDFWSSTPSKGRTYWSLYAIINGQPYAHESSDTQYIRCVRCLDK